WLLLITDGLIEVPLKKYMARLSELKYEEAKALTGYKKVMGKGTLAETSNLRRFEEATKKRRTYETYIAQIFLANPAYTRALKLKKQNWLAKSGQKSSIEKFALNVTPHTVKEKAWLDEMKKRIENTE
ncbi:hypothetical protein HZC07_02265, partial [Candidatus Micrarchaeota archaeon]|nr:hypothetical protein [Candidatus Micrarchaeota archaeon]